MKLLRVVRVADVFFLLVFVFLLCDKFILNLEDEKMFDFIRIATQCIFGEMKINSTEEKKNRTPK